MIILSLNADGSTRAQTGQPRNLLHNWDFRNPVNQREIVSGAAVVGSRMYLDRWKLAARTMVWTRDVGCASADGALQQYMEIPPSMLAGRTVTISVMLGDGTILSNSGVWPDVTNAQTAQSVSLGATLYASYINVYRSAGVVLCGATYTNVPMLQLSVLGQLTIQAVKLELGAASTLANDSPMDYGAELARCQRYYQPQITHFAQAYTAGYLEPMTLIGEMRIPPSIGSVNIVTTSGVQVAMQSAGVATKYMTGRINALSVAAGEWHYVTFVADANL